MERDPELALGDYKSLTYGEFLIDGQPLRVHLMESAASNGFDWFRDVILPTDGDYTSDFTWAEPLGCVGGAFERDYIDQLLGKTAPWFADDRVGLAFCAYCYDAAFHRAVTLRCEFRADAVTWEGVGFQYSYEASDSELTSVFEGVHFEFSAAPYCDLLRAAREEVR